jgi:hypothetical protein
MLSIFHLSRNIKELKHHTLLIILAQSPIVFARLLRDGRFLFFLLTLVCWRRLSKRFCSFIKSSSEMNLMLSICEKNCINSIIYYLNKLILGITFIPVSLQIGIFFRNRKYSEMRYFYM